MPGTIVAIESRRRTDFRRALEASLAARTGIGGGRTVGEFKAALAALGVTDDMALASIEYGVMQHGNGRVIVDVADDGLEIREGRAL